MTSLVIWLCNNTRIACVNVEYTFPGCNKTRRKLTLVFNLETFVFNSVCLNIY